MLEKYITMKHFDKYEDFVKDFKITVPENFNFGFDVVDATADEEPNKKCLVWCNEHGENRTFTFLDMKKETNKAVNFFKSLGIKKGDLQHRLFFYFSCCFLALTFLRPLMLSRNSLISLVLPTTNIVSPGNNESLPPGTNDLEPLWTKTTLTP